MARYARIQPGELVVDPMAGVGSIPIEASQTWNRARYLCGDISGPDCISAMENVKQYASLVLNDIYPNGGLKFCFH
jgi:tRNA G10  N-methylase Trm11